MESMRSVRGLMGRLRRILAARKGDLRRLRAGTTRGVSGGIRPESLIWIFCTGRSGSTWLASMMGDLEGHAMWNEPLVGALFGQFYYVRAAHRRASGEVILGERYKKVWLRSIRSMVLEGAAARYPALPDAGHLVIKEPHGSLGAPLLMEALPESRMILLVRDPRDVVSSALDSQRRGGWSAEMLARNPAREHRQTPADADPDAFVERHARTYLQDVGRAREAYEAHGGRKALIRYEDLRRDTPATMRRVCSELGIAVDPNRLARVVEKHSWEKIPEEKRGRGKFYRKATPGGWREDLTPEQASTVERMTAPLLQQFYR